MTFIFELHSATHWVQETSCCVKMCDKVIDLLSSTTNHKPTSVLFEEKRYIHVDLILINSLFDSIFFDMAGSDG